MASSSGHDARQDHRPGLAGHPHVEHGQVDLVRAHDLEAAAPSAASSTSKSSSRIAAQRLAHARLVVDDEHDRPRPDAVRGTGLGGPASARALGIVRH